MSDSQDKTELPSSKRLKDALEEGNVIASRELYNFFALLGCSLFFMFLFGSIAKSLLLYLRAFIAYSWNQHFREAALLYLRKPLALALPAFILFSLLGLCANFLHHRQFIISFKPLVPNFGRISLNVGFKRLFSKRIAFEGVKILLKLVLTGCIFFFALKAVILECSGYFGFSVNQLLQLVHYKVTSFVLISFLLFSFIAGLDYFLQVRSYIDSLKMSKEELMREYKDTEGHPRIKGRIRANMTELLRGRLSSTMAKANLVIWDSESVAVVLQYDAEFMRLKLKAKGKAAANIVKMAQSMQVPLVASKSLASSLHMQVGVNCLVPEYYYSHIRALNMQ